MNVLSRDGEMPMAGSAMMSIFSMRIAIMLVRLWRRL